MSKIKTPRVRTHVHFAKPLGQARQTSRPLFAQPIPSSVTAASLVMAACAALVLFARPNGAQNLAPTAKHKRTPTVRAGKQHTGASVAGNGPVILAQNDRTDPVAGGSESSAETNTAVRRSLGFYTQGVSGAMFSAPQPPAPKAAPKPIPIKKEKPPVLPKVPVVEINPFADWSYTGTIKMGDQMTALLENTKTKEGQFIKVGESFMGAQVIGITDQMVTLNSAGRQSMLAKSDTITITPLNNNAAFLAGQGGQPGPQGPQGPPPPQAMPAPPMGGNPGDGPQVVLPNGRVLNGRRAQRYQQMLNNSFNK
jgi:hypothetical protein